MGNNKNRRAFLADATKSLGLLGMSPWLSNFVVQTLSTEVLASGVTSANGTDKIYIFIASPGGPPRWYFDAPLTPTGKMSEFSHTGMGTFIGMDGVKPVVTYKTWQDPVSKYHLPPVWGSNPAGGSFKNCLANAMFFRGIDAEINSHELCRYRNLSPIIGGISVAGLIAQKTQTPFPAASAGSIGTSFKAEKPLAPVALNYTVSSTVNPVKTVMSYFSGQAPVDNLAVKQVLSEFDKYAEANGFRQTALSEAKDRSDGLVKQGVAAFNEKWQPTYDKYLIKVKEAMGSNNTGLFLDSKQIRQPAMVDGKPDIRTRRDNTNGFLTTGANALDDLKNMIDQEKTTLASLAATFATIEILVTMGLTQVVTTDIRTCPSNMIMGKDGAMFNLTEDQHSVGSLVSVIGTTYGWRAVLSCTEELVETLKEVGLFDKTLIHFGSEFSRNARIDGSGSDHGFKGASSLMISGMIKKTGVIGNTKKDTGSYAGSWGLAAPHPAVTTSAEVRAIQIKDVALTACSLLGINGMNKITNNGFGLLKNNGDGTYELPTGSAGEAKNV